MHMNIYFSIKIWILCTNQQFYHKSVNNINRISLAQFFLRTHGFLPSNFMFFVDMTIKMIKISQFQISKWVLSTRTTTKEHDEIKLYNSIKNF